MGNRYNDGEISELEAVVVAHSSDFEQVKSPLDTNCNFSLILIFIHPITYIDSSFVHPTFQDNNLGLVKQAVASLYKRNILRLTQKYLTLSLQDIANMVQLANAKEAETHVLQMVVYSVCPTLDFLEASYLTI